MTLAEKIAALRGERKLSQGDLAEKLDVSRQSVSKWETGQAVPELEKIIRLADVFGVSVDELVRDGETPKPETAKTEVTERIVYVEKPRKGLTPAQILGVICAVMGAGLTFLGVIGQDPEWIVIGPVVVVVSLPLLLAAKHPLLCTGWLIWAAGTMFLCHPGFVGMMSAGWLPFMGFVNSVRWLIQDGHMGGDVLLLIMLFLVAYGVLSVLTVVLPVCTICLARKKWKSRKESQKETEAE